MEDWFVLKKCCHLYLYYWCARLHHGPTKTELTWNQKLHSCFIKKASISIAKMVFKGGCPSELFTPQEAVRNKNTPIKNWHHSCGRLIHLPKKIATCTYTIDVPDSTMDQPKQNWLGIKSFTSASSKEHRLQLQQWLSKGMPFRAVHPPRSSKEKTTPIKNRPDLCGRLICVSKKQLKTKCCHLYLYYWCARLHPGPTKTELTWNQKLHSCCIKRGSISIQKWFSKGGALQSCSPPKKQ